MEQAMILKKFSELSEASGDVGVFTLGRFNPPTTGHEKLITKLDSVAKQNSASMYVFPTHSNDAVKNPLPHPLKVAYMKKMYKKYAKNIQISKARNVFEVAKVLYDKGHKSIIMVVGSDRVAEFANLLKKYDGVKSTHGFYEFESIKVVSAGERDPDAEGVSGMSASKMRAAAVDGDKDSFLQGVPSSFKDGDKLYNDVRKNMGIREERDMGNMDDYETLRDAYLTGKIWNIDDLVEANGIEGRIVNRGTNYLSFCDGDGKVHKAWLHDIKLEEFKIKNNVVYISKKEYNNLPSASRNMEDGSPTLNIFMNDDDENPTSLPVKFTESRNYKKEYANYQGTPEQIARRSSRNKARRVMGDKTKIGMDVGHKDNDPLNNDPKNLRNEDPSVNRREPRLREKDDLDEMAWYDKLKAKIDQMTHPTNYEVMVKDYLDGMMKGKGKPKKVGGIMMTNQPSGVAADIARKNNVSSRSLIMYINKLVDKGILPKELKAEVQTEMRTFKDLTKQINEVKQDPDIKGSKGTEPAKYYAKDAEGDKMSVSTKKKRDAHFAKKKSGPAPGDSAKTKPSTHTKKFKQMFGEVLPDNADQGDYIDDFTNSDAPQFKGKSKEKRKDMAIAAYLSKNESYQLDEKLKGLVNKAEKSGMPYNILKKVYDRGMAAYKTGHRPGATPQQWAFARVNSFVTKSAGTWGKADKDLAKQVEQIEEACWVGYKQVGMKKKGSKEVPNCVPEEKELNEWGEITEKDTKSGKELNNPTKGDVKKYKVYVKNAKGNVVKVEFGDPNMSIKRDDPDARKNFRARHNCDQKKDKTTAGYWSCKFWSTKSVTDLMKG